MVANRYGKKRFFAKLHGFGPFINRRPIQGLLNFNSWQAHVFIEILATMLTEQEFTDEVFEPITETYARFVKKASRNIWSLSHSTRLVVRVKYRRHAQRLAELLGAILSRHQFINLVLKPINLTYIDTYAKCVLGVTLSNDNNDDQYSGMAVVSDWNCAVEAYSSTPYRKIELYESRDSSLINSRTALLPIDSA